MSRDDAARIGGMDCQTLRDWVHRFNRLGADGLTDIRPSGRPRKLSAERDAELKRLVEAGPGPESAVARWRWVDLKRVLSQRFDVDLAEKIAAFGAGVRTRFANLPLEKNRAAAARIR